MFTIAVALLVVAFLIIRLAPSRLRLALWCVVIVGAVVPWMGFRDHTHWDQAQWIPFVPPPDIGLRDLAVNILLYVPFGVFFVGSGPSRQKIAKVMAWAVLLSVATEVSQVFSHGRFPTATDVVMNGLGAMIGATILRRRR